MWGPGGTHSQVVSQTANLSSLVLQVINELAIFTVLPSKDFPKFEDRGVNSAAAVLLKYASEGAEDVFTQGHFCW